MSPRLHFAAFLFLIPAAPCALSQNLPPTLPTTPPIQPPAQPVRQTTGSQPPHRAVVSYNAGKLAIQAENSSLNQILRDISRLTGMKITGGVIDERVFGAYGPAETGAVLTSLLDGTGSNMLLIENPQRSPQELVLTPRQGGPTPPNPNASRERDEQADLPPQLTPRNDATAQPQAPPQPNPFNRPRRDLPPGAVATDLSTTNAGAAPAAANDATTTTEQSPNGVKTPEQIYQQLLRLQQQQAKPPQ